MHFELGILSINWNIYIFEKYLIHSWFLVILVAVLRIMLMLWRTHRICYLLKEKTYSKSDFRFRSNIPVRTIYKSLT